MKKTYQVAGHRFAVIMPDSNVAWQMMQNYDPFLVEDSNDVVFTVRWTDILPDRTKKRLLFEECKGVGFTRTEFFQLNDKWLFDVAPDKDAPVCFHLMTDKQFSDACFLFTDDPRFSINGVIMLMFAHATAQRNTLMFHASVTMHQGKGYLFMGKSGTGKSTHSQLWINNIERCELLNDDNPVIKVENDGTVRVYGTPWSGKTPCYRNLNVPVGAIVDLHQAPKNVIQRLTIPQAYGVMLKSFSGCRFIKENADGYHATNEKILLTVPCYSLDCLPNAEAAWLCHNTVVAS